MRGLKIAGIVLGGLSVLIFLIAAFATCALSRAGPADVEEEGEGEGGAGGETEDTENQVTSQEIAGVVIEGASIGTGINDLAGCCRIC